MPGADTLALGTAPAILVFAAIFLGGAHFHPLRSLVRDRRTLVSFSAGMSAAYVFVHMMPELHEARMELLAAASPSLELRYEGIAIYFVALIGFVCFYGLEQLRTRASEQGQEEQFVNVHLAGTAAYAALMSYLLVRSAGESAAATVLYTVAIGGHFLGLEHALREEYGESFRRRGRWLLAAACLLGWTIGVFLGLPAFLLALLVAFISGGVIMTNSLMELSEGKDGRPGPFIAGSLLYGLLLVPLG